MTEPQCSISWWGSTDLHCAQVLFLKDLNGDDYAAIPLKESEKMHIGYIKHKGTKLEAKLGEIYIDALKNTRIKFINEKL